MTTPVITSITGNFKNDSSITINGSGFTAKTNASPLFWWTADMGSTPSSLGRKTTWDGTFNGSTNTSIKAPGRTQSIAWDFSLSEGAILGQVNVVSDQMYVCRKTYDGFTADGAVALRTRFTGLSGTLQVGHTVTGTTSGATGVIQSFDANAGLPYILYEPDAGSIGASPPTDFIAYEAMTTSGGASMTSNEYVGLLRTFNFKTLRYWGTSNDMYPNVQGANANKNFSMVPEGTDSTFNPASWTNQLGVVPYAWKTEEFKYQTSTLDTADGIFEYTQNGILGYSGHNFKTITTTYQTKYYKLFQSQVSNGAQPNSTMYYDSLYIDDTWHHVIVARYSTYSKCWDRYVVIPTAWSDTAVTVDITSLGSLSKSKAWFLYITNGEGITSEPFALSPQSPGKPII